jgi:hypothetical protein
MVNREYFLARRKASKVMRLADFVGVFFRWTASLSLVLAVSGCFASNTPTIATSEAEDVGATLQYWSRNHDDPKSGLIRLVRLDGTEYQLQLVDPYDPVEVSPFANGLSVRRLGSRNADPVYLVQFDLEQFDLDTDFTPQEMGFRYFSYLVSVNADGVGSVGSFRCDTPAVVERAAEAGIRIGCMDFVDTIIADLGSPQEAGLAAGFLAELQREDLIDWEDKSGVGVLDWIQ